MKKIGTIISNTLIFSFLFFSSCEQKINQQTELNLEDTKIIKQLFDGALTSRETYELLDYLTNKIGHRLSGSKGASEAVEWTEKIMNKYDFDKVYRYRKYQ